jgi:hypothetical protein
LRCYFAFECYGDPWRRGPAYDGVPNQQGNCNLQRKSKDFISCANTSCGIPTTDIWPTLLLDRPPLIKTSQISNFPCFMPAFEEQESSILWTLLQARSVTWKRYGSRTAIYSAALCYSLRAYCRDQGSRIEALGLPNNAEALINLGDGRELSNAISVSPSLTYLNLSFCGIRREAGAILAAGLGSSNVTYLDVFSNGLCSGIRPILHIIPQSKLRTVSLSHKSWHAKNGPRRVCYIHTINCWNDTWANLILTLCIHTATISRQH